MTHRHQSAVDGGPPLGLELPGPYVDGEPYWPLKRRWLAGESVSPEALVYIGAGMADLSRPRDGGWRQPTLSDWTSEVDEASDDLKALLSLVPDEEVEAR